jgi:hypothetical protein
LHLGKAGGFPNLWEVQIVDRETPVRRGGISKEKLIKSVSFKKILKFGDGDGELQANRS